MTQDTQLEPYPVVRRTVGHLVKQEIPVVEMDRETFVGIVDAALAYQHYAPIREKILATARTMDRFPFGEWIDADRGCGCIVGEYLVAQQQLEDLSELEAREMLVQRRNLEFDENGSTRPTINTMIKALEDGDLLYSFGNQIDREFRSHLRHAGVIVTLDTFGEPLKEPRVVHYSDYGRDADDHVESILVVDE